MPSKEVEKQPRCLNHTPADRSYLVDLVAKYPAVTCKRTDKTLKAAKKAAWEHLTEEFNSSGLASQKRTSEMLLKCWKNMESRIKATSASRKSDQCRTGGGPLMSVSSTDPIDERIEALIPKDVFGLQNGFDDDSSTNVPPGDDIAQAKDRSLRMTVTAIDPTSLSGPFMDFADVSKTTFGSTVSSEAATGLLLSGSFNNQSSPQKSSVVALKRQILEEGLLLIKKRRENETLKGEILNTKEQNTRVTRRPRTEGYALPMPIAKYY